MKTETKDRRTWLRAALAAWVLAASPAGVELAAGAPVPITGYDIEQTPGPGWGCWSHSYAGTITDTGRTASGSVVCTPEGSHIFNYSGGSGTLNDGLRATTINATHLFTTRNAVDGQPIAPVITLHLGATVLVNRISLFGGDIPLNAIPGALTGATVEIGGTSAALATISFGSPNGIGVLADDLLDLSGTPLAGIPTDRIVLRNFTSSFFGSPFDQFSITEIEVDGTPAATPIAIDIKPGSSPNAINPRSAGKTPVAILSSGSFDAFSEMVLSSLTFGRTGDERSLSHCGGPEDVNGDGLPDVVCHFDAATAGFVAGDTQGVLKGNTRIGTPVQGVDSVRVVH